MSYPALLGRFAKLKIQRFAAPGAYLATSQGDDRDEILLIGSEVPAGAKEGDEVEVFVHHDSRGRPIATTRRARLELGGVAFLQVTQRAPMGTFVDWGLAKELLVPFAEQTTDMNVGERYAVGLYIDKSGRLAGTMRVSEMLWAGAPEDTWTRDEWVEGEAWREQAGIGLFVILEQRFIGVVPAHEPHGLARGEGARFRVANVLPDGKIELSLRHHAHDELAGDAQRILAVLRAGAARDIGDRSSPEEIRRVFGLSKKAFKRAAGRLFKERAVVIDGAGCLKLTR